MPKHLLSEVNDLNRATYVYNFIRDHFTWNGINWVSSEISVKESFDKRNGSVAAVNLSLYNSLQAASSTLKVIFLLFVSTRSNGIPTKLLTLKFQ